MGQVEWPHDDLLAKDMQVSPKPDYSGQAALSIIESLLLAMNDGKLLPEGEIIGILNDAAKSHENAIGHDSEAEMHAEVAALINRIISGGNSVRRP
nr:hypothetical protein [Ponticaulis sp.]